MWSDVNDVLVRVDEHGQTWTVRPEANRWKITVGRQTLAGLHHSAEEATKHADRLIAVG
jgi:hypothetical protein